MDCYYVTGASRGIGLAVAERLLREPDVRVIGIGRTATLTHPRYTHRTLDLSLMEQVAAFQFDEMALCRRAVLVNNAAMIAVAQLGNIPASDLVAIHQTNAIAPALLMNNFVHGYKTLDLEQAVVCNMTSRAGTTPIAGGSAYCAAKAALEMSTMVAAKEAEMAGFSNLHFLIANPGETDTQMQAYLAKSNTADFPNAERARQRMESGLLMSASDVAARLVPLLKDPSLAPSMRFDVQSLPVTP